MTVLGVTGAAIVDAGPLVASLDRRERHHDWSVMHMRELPAPLLVCEPVLVEAWHLLWGLPIAQDALFGLLESGAVKLAFYVEQHIVELRWLLQKYRDRPMSLADACIVRMAELHERHVVFTLDSDFEIYRKHGRAPLALIRPSGPQ